MMSAEIVDVAIMLNIKHNVEVLVADLSGNNVNSFETILPYSFRVPYFPPEHPLFSEGITAPLHNGFVAEKTEYLAGNIFVSEVFVNSCVCEYFDPSTGIKFVFHTARYGNCKVDFELRDKAIAIDWQGASLIMGAPRWVPFRDLLVFPWLRRQHRLGLQYLVDQQIIRI